MKVPSSHPNKSHHLKLRIIFSSSCLLVIVMLAGLVPDTLLHHATKLPVVYCRTATTPEQRQALCEDKDPTKQQCTYDATTVQSEDIDDGTNHLVGQVQLRFSSACDTYWGRVIALVLGTSPRMVYQIGNNNEFPVEIQSGIPCCNLNQASSGSVNSNMEYKSRIQLFGFINVDGIAYTNTLVYSSTK